MLKTNLLNIEEWQEKAKDRALFLEPYYKELRNEFVEPDNVSVISHYFLKKWAPLLGPTLTVLIIRLRMYCYYNKKTKEKRDWCFPSQDTLAKDIGVSWRTVERELQRDIANNFIRREPRYVYNPRLQKKVRTSDMYYIAMDDPLVPEDEELLAKKLEAKSFMSRVDEQAKEGISPNCHFVSQVRNPVDNPPPNCQFVSQVSTDNLSEEDLLLRSTLNNVNVNDVDKNTFQNPKEYTKAEALKLQVGVIVQDILDILGDPQSKNFYTLLTTKILETQNSTQLIYRALSETKEQAREGKIRQSKGAYFTDLIKRYCAEDGIKLKG